MEPTDKKELTGDAYLLTRLSKEAVASEVNASWRVGVM